MLFRSGQLTVKPRFPAWMIPLLGLLFLLLCVAGAAALSAINTRNEKEEATRIAQLTATAVFEQGNVAAAQATGAAATQAFEEAALAGDDDSDGLSNEREDQLGTDHSKPDTDGDGLLDGQEVNQYGTDPKKQDTDGDTLIDGAEVTTHNTSPTEADTDGDGTKDGVEVNLGTDPLLPPTATVPPTATATDAPEPTVTPTVVTRTPTPTPTPFPAGYWHGIWETECEYLLCGQINFTHDAAQNIVTGTFAEGAGTLVGIFENNLLTGTWSASGETGSFDFWITPDGTTWYGNWNKSYYWCGYRTRGEAPTPCGVATWSGDWLTDCSSSCETITFTQNGEFVEGVYAGGEGTISATASYTTLNGNWFRGSGDGTITFFMQNEGVQFNGNWNEEVGWCGYREGGGLPDPCYAEQVFIFQPLILVTLQPFLPVIPLPTATP